METKNYSDSFFWPQKNEIENAPFEKNRFGVEAAKRKLRDYKPTHLYSEVKLCGFCSQIILEQL